MKTIITKKLIGLALSVFSIAAQAQCPTVTNMGVTLGANGTATITPALSAPTSTQTMYYWSVSPSATQTSNMWQSNGTFQFPTNGTYTLSISISDSLSGCWLNGVTVININNMAANSCSAAFTAQTDSGCVTHFINSSVGSNLTYNWNINGNSYTSANPTVSLSNGTYPVVLFSYSGGALCDSIYQNITVGCGGSGTTTPCQASFYSYTDSSCVTHFINTSTGNLYSTWNINGTTYTASLNPAASLADGVYYATLYTYASGGVLCDSTTQQVTVACNSGTTTPAGCQANASFFVFADSTNVGNYFAYNNASGTGTLSYAWDFGDASPISSQQYPFHQYATPGQYIICLTVTATSGTTTCSDTYCDSSSTQKMAAGFLMSQVNVIASSVTSIKKVEKEIGLKAFPNPIADELTIEAIANNDAKLTYVLTDAVGRTVLVGDLNNTKTTINTSSLEKGFYSLSVTNEKGSSLKTIKLVK